MTALATRSRAILRIAAVLCLVLGSAPARALDEATLVATMQQATAIAIGRALTGSEQAALADETVRATAADPEAMARLLPILAETAMAMRTTENPATRGVLYDTLRQLYTLAFSPVPEPLALGLFVRDDRLAGEHEPGMGLALSDIYASAWLRALHEGRFDHPDAVALSQADLDAHGAEVTAKFRAEVPENQQVMSRMNAWAAGVRAGWAGMTPAERRAATAVTTEPDIPDATVVEKVTGTPDLFKWIAGIDPAFDAELRGQFPAMIRFHEEGGTAAAMSGFFVRLGGGDLAADWGQFQSLQMLQNLNNYMARGGSFGDFNAGSIMLGLEY